MKRKNKKILVALILIVFILGAGYGIVRTLGLDEKIGIRQEQKDGKGQDPEGPPEEGPASGRPGTPGSGMGGQESAPIPVRVVEAELGDVRRFIKVNGDVITKRRVTVYAAISGKLVSLEARVGDYVEKNRVLAYVDPSRPGESYAQSPVEAAISGTVISMPVHVGDMITPQSPVATIGDLRDLQIETYIPERFIASLRAGQPGEVRFEAFPGELFQARVTEIDPVVDPVSRALGIRLEPARWDRRVRPGMFASIELTTESRSGVLTVPRDSVLRYYGETVVFVADLEGTAHRRSVTLGIEGEKNFEVLEGLEEGEQIVIEGQNFLGDKDRIRIVE